MIVPIFQRIATQGSLHKLLPSEIAAGKYQPQKQLQSNFTTVVIKSKLFSMVLCFFLSRLSASEFPFFIYSYLQFYFFGSIVFILFQKYKSSIDFWYGMIWYEEFFELSFRFCCKRFNNTQQIFSLMIDDAQVLINIMDGWIE